MLKNPLVPSLFIIQGNNNINVFNKDNNINVFNKDNNINVLTKITISMFLPEHRGQ